MARHPLPWKSHGGDHKSAMTWQHFTSPDRLLKHCNPFETLSRAPGNCHGRPQKQKKIEKGNDEHSLFVPHLTPVFHDSLKPSKENELWKMLGKTPWTTQRRSGFHAISRLSSATPSGSSSFLGHLLCTGFVIRNCKCRPTCGGEIPWRSH